MKERAKVRISRDSKLDRYDLNRLHAGILDSLVFVFGLAETGTQCFSTEDLATGRRQVATNTITTSGQKL
jgi:hypothetical protein